MMVIDLDVFPHPHQRSQWSYWWAAETWEDCWWSVDWWSVCGTRRCCALSRDAPTCTRRCKCLRFLWKSYGFGKHFQTLGLEWERNPAKTQSSLWWSRCDPHFTRLVNHSSVSTVEWIMRISYAKMIDRRLYSALKGDTSLWTDQKLGRKWLNWINNKKVKFSCIKSYQCYLWTIVVWKVASAWN